MNDQKEAFVIPHAAVDIHPEFANRNCITGFPDFPGFQPFPKMARLNREVIVTEKLDGTNAQILITPARDVSFEHEKFATLLEDRMEEKAVAIFAGSRNRWITPGADNFGFASWVKENAEELKKLGPGRHFGEWWGGGIQRGYGVKEKRFSLFNVGRWESSSNEGFPGIFQTQPSSLGITLPGPACCHVVPTLWIGNYDLLDARDHIEILRIRGSVAAPGFMQPEGIVVYHTAAEKCFKVTLEGDEKPKGLEKAISPEQLIAGKPAADEVFRQKCEQ